MLDFLTSSRIALSLLLILSICLIQFLRKLHFQRSLVKGLPGPPHSYLFGHLLSLYAVTKNQPSRAAAQTFWLPLQEHYNLPDAFYFDPWPLGPLVLMIFDAELMQDVTVKTSLPKHRFVEAFVKHLGGPRNLVSAEGAEWKKWRSAFNPGFSAAHLMTLVPAIVDECSIFSSLMAQHARDGDLFRMEMSTTRLTVDIIGRVVLDHSFDSQHGPNVLVDSIIEQIKWIPLGAQTNPYELIDIRRPFILAWNSYKMRRYVSRCLDERFATRASRGKGRSIIDLALETYLKEIKGTEGNVEDAKTLDPEFKKAAIDNLIIFIFAGHDTTSGTICYAYYYLSKHPEKLAKARKELDEVFGPDLNAVAERLKEEPHLLNRLDYILAVTREVLRMQPPASPLRQGQKGFFLRDPDTGDALPTEHCMVWPVDVGLGRNKKYWPDPHSFRPERFLEPGGYNKDAWVAFSKGVRNCIGQELAVIETKVILAMTLREFDFQAAFDEVEKLRGDGSGYPCDVAGVQEQFGDEAYQIQLGTAKPREGMPCRIRLRDTK